MQQNSLWKMNDGILRVLDAQDGRVLVVECSHQNMPRWIQSDRLREYEMVEESILCTLADTARDETAMPVSAQRIIRGRFTVIAGILPYIGDKGMRCHMITLATEQSGLSRRTVCNYLWLYLAYQNILGGSDSFTIIGTSGIGKSSAISKAIRLISGGSIIELGQPCAKIVPCVVVQCPFDSSEKGLLLEILRQVDEELDTKYYDNAVRARATTDMLIGSVSQVALNHIGLLVVDEIQHVVNSKNGKALVGSLTQLINCSGISICMVGTPDSCQFFEQAMQLARRSLGLHYSELPYDGYFREFCRTLFG